MNKFPIETDPPKAAPKPLPEFPAPAKRKKSGRRAVLITLVVLFALGAGTVVYHRHNMAQVPGMRPGGLAGGGRRGGGGFGLNGPVPVLVNLVRKSDLNIVLDGLGTVTPLATVTVRTQISGQLTSVNFTEGQLVNQGDLLAIIDPRPYQVQLEQAQGQLLEAQAQFKEAQIDLDRYVTLAGQDSISKQQVDAQRALVSQYEGMVKVNQAAVDSAQLNLTYCHIVAPFSGRVGLRLVDQGNYVTPGDSSGLAILTEVRPISVIFTLPEDNIPAVLKQVRAGAKIRIDAYNRDSTVKLATGTLATIDNTVDPTTGTFKLRAVFPNDDDALFPDQFVNVSMLLDVQHGDTVVPTSSIERGQQGPFVYIVGADNKVAAKSVTLGAVDGERQAVLSGVSPGDKVVVDGADRLKDGLQVAPSFPTPGTGRPANSGPPDGERRHRRPQSGSN
jgi:multidrug efflux system membrane fusion protein